MFGEDIILGTQEKKLDNKGRIVLPSFTMAEIGDEILFTYDENNNEINLFLLNSYKKLILDLKKKIDNTQNVELRMIFIKELNRLMDTAAGYVGIDKQKRVLIPKYIRDSECLRTDSILLLNGGIDNGVNIVKCKKK